VHLSQQHLDRLDALSRPTLGFPADVMRDASVVSGIYGARLADIDDPRARAVRRTTTDTYVLRRRVALCPASTRRLEFETRSGARLCRAARCCVGRGRG
jgi:hypothetical protein